MKRTVSILICTRNRAKKLAQTLESLAATRMPQFVAKAEVIVVDNRSDDDTRRVTETCPISHMDVRYLYEPLAGKAHSCNTALAAAKGEILLFTDDDVIVPCNWIEAMCEPLLNGSAHAVAGAVRIPPHLNLPWMDAYHRGWLGSTEGFTKNEVHNMVGGNMGIVRGVLDDVPGFDPELGPGMLGYHEEALFTWQLKLAGCRVHFLPDVVVEHYFPESRLTREGMLRTAENAGRSSAYVAHHWEHRKIGHVYAKLAKARARLAYWRLRRFGLRPPADQSPRWEMEMIMDLAYFRQYLTERRRLRHYAPYALKRSEPSKVSLAS